MKAHDMEILGYVMAIQLRWGDVDGVEILSHEFAIGFSSYFKLNENIIIELAINNSKIVTLDMINTILNE